MRKHTILFALFALLLTAAIILSSCAKTDPKITPEANEAAAVKSDIAVTDIAAAIEANLSDAALLTAVDSDYIEGMTDIDLTGVEEYILKVQTSGSAVTSYGVFKTSEENSDALKATLQGYIDTLEANWESFNYLPGELPKLKAAKAIKIGGYAMFVIAADSERQAAEKAFTDALKEG